jgi:hypothetical protein
VATETQYCSSWAAITIHNRSSGSSSDSRQEEHSSRLSVADWPEYHAARVRGAVATLKDRNTNYSDCVLDAEEEFSSNVGSNEDALQSPAGDPAVPNLDFKLDIDSLSSKISNDHCMGFSPPLSSTSLSIYTNLHSQSQDHEPGPGSFARKIVFQPSKFDSATMLDCAYITESLGNHIASEVKLLDRPNTQDLGLQGNFPQLIQVLFTYGQAAEDAMIAHAVT